jgi:transcriptional regulator NrdR family protein
VLNRSGSDEPFLRSELVSSIAKACDHLSANIDTAFALSDTVEKLLLEDLHKDSSKIKTSSIFDITCLVLKRFDPIAHLKYLATYSPTNLDKRDLKQALKG